MTFDDYNYKAFNEFVLLQEPSNPSKALDEMELRLNTKLNIKETNSNELTVADINTINQNEKPFS
jgi:hypothetical protein